jgi:hypothetical protein
MISVPATSSFLVLEVLRTPAQGDNVDRLLMGLKLHWKEKLQPFGDGGYNSIK